MYHHTNGSNMDVLEIDGASNRGIDEIRDLREKNKTFSTAASKKVYIIDEVHIADNRSIQCIAQDP